jgi:hypothetical protein
MRDHDRARIVGHCPELVERENGIPAFDTIQLDLRQAVLEEVFDVAVISGGIDDPVARAEAVQAADFASQVLNVHHVLFARVVANDRRVIAVDILDDPREVSIIDDTVADTDGRPI